MSQTPIFIGDIPLTTPSGDIQGRFTSFGDDDYYQIAHYDQMRPFFMSIVSPADHWMFISSNGALSAGRRNPQNALFPYYTDDKIHDSPELTGSKTILMVHEDGKRYLWEPFSDRMQGAYPTTRNLYKHVYGHKIIFEEINERFQLSFCYAWETSETYGFVKRAWLQNMGTDSCQIEVLDGIQNILPYGVNLDMQTELSTLVDAYKKNELDQESGMGLFSLSSILVDKPEPSEALKTTSVWSVGLGDARRLLSSTQLNPMRMGKELKEEVDIRAERGAYFLHKTLELPAQSKKEWYIVAEVEQSITQVVDLAEALTHPESLLKSLKEDIAKGTVKLTRIAGNSDALQMGEDRLTTARHFSNVLFNVMRGGIFDEDYLIHKNDLLDFIKSWNQLLWEKNQTFFDSLTEKISLKQLKREAEKTSDKQLIRLCYEYLPLTFSRRHGDPSRPWNFFSIETQREDGSRILNYQGNWRDIFQNWEALCLSYPEFTESIICKFLNASTADGYNPYRITRDGIDWEVTDPSDPWSFIGYWGDHQIIYLLKLLETSKKHHPGLLADFLTRDMFVFAHVPYKIKPFEELLKDPHNTIDFDNELEAEITQRVARIGADAKLIWITEDEPYRVNLTEKLLLTSLTKLSNLIPEGGIWMNTQRPEWNDANNALVGYGISMVTLCYLRRFQGFCLQLFEETDEESIPVSKELAELLSAMHTSFEANKAFLSSGFSDENRMKVLRGLGEAASEYRMRIYEQGFSGEKVSIRVADIQSFIELSQEYLDQSIKANKRSDGLYHSYNLMTAKGNALKVDTLYEMLEGQVAVLSTELLSARESVDLLTALKASKLYREDQYSYLLYPDRILPRFTEKNQIPASAIERSVLLKELLANGNTDIVERDSKGNYHFYAGFRNAKDLEAGLHALKSATSYSVTASEVSIVQEIFEEIFDHRSFTGRSGTFYGYEGLGSIYWHMVSKLLLAVNETYFRAEADGESQETLGKLIEFYYDIRAGLGLNKSPELYGAFPTDPYSHTPGNAGAQQPGMTGQVKEDILSRMGELGVVIDEGSIRFHPILLRSEEFLTSPQTFTYYSAAGEIISLPLDKGMLGFTYCQTPIIYHESDEKKILVSYRDGRKEEISGWVLPERISASIFEREYEVAKIEVYVKGL